MPLLKIQRLVHTPVWSPACENRWVHSDELLRGQSRKRKREESIKYKESVSSSRGVLDTLLRYQWHSYMPRNTL